MIVVLSVVWTVTESCVVGRAGIGREDFRDMRTRHSGLEILCDLLKAPVLANDWRVASPNQSRLPRSRVWLVLILISRRAH